MTASAGWFEDPLGRHQHRYWDGSAWSAHVADAGVTGHDPPGAPALGVDSRRVVQEQQVAQSIGEIIGSASFERLVARAPLTDGETKVDWFGVAEALRAEHIDPDEIVAVSWCIFGTKNIEALIDPPSLAIVHPAGVLSTAGKRGMMNKGLKAWTIRFPPCKAWGPTETVDERGYGKYCIDFGGPGAVLLGRLEWIWRGKRFRDPRENMMASASERDRILDVIEQTFAN